MKATVLLADFAQADPTTGKVNALGMGWSNTATPTGPMAVIVLIQVDWDESNQLRTARLALLDEDGKDVTVPGPAGPQPLSVEAGFEVGRPPGLPKGSPLTVPLTINLAAGIPLTAGKRYEWRVSVNGYNDNWSASFHVVGQPA